jgi:hypothetical protein
MYSRRNSKILMPITRNHDRELREKDDIDRRKEENVKG